MIKLKKAGEVLDPNPRTELINHFVEGEIEHLEQYVREISVNKSDQTEVLNQLFRETLDEVWG